MSETYFCLPPLLSRRSTGYATVPANQALD
jgi:hypothetical protein